MELSIAVPFIISILLLGAMAVVLLMCMKDKDGKPVPPKELLSRLCMKKPAAATANTETVEEGQPAAAEETPAENAEEAAKSTDDKAAASNTETGKAADPVVEEHNE